MKTDGNVNTSPVAASTASSILGHPGIRNARGFEVHKVMLTVRSGNEFGLDTAWSEKRKLMENDSIRKQKDVLPNEHELL